MKLFGKDLFSKASEKKKKPKEQYDFAQHGILDKNYSPSVGIVNNYATSYVTWSGGTTGTNIDSPVVVQQMPVVDVPPEKKNKSKKKEPEKVKISPKELYEAKALHRDDLRIITDSAYLKEQIDTLRKKAELMKGTSDSGATGYGKEEVMSMIERLHNRFRLFPGHQQTVFEDFPYTTNDAIRAVLKDNSHLRANRVAEFIPDLPKDAVDAMTKYTDATQKLCGKNPVFYIVADKKDFGDIGNKRDPILLAQSPFGFFWQILGAWDEEMVLLEEL